MFEAETPTQPPVVHAGARPRRPAGHPKGRWSSELWRVKDGAGALREAPSERGYVHITRRPRGLSCELSFQLSDTLPSEERLRRPPRCLSPGIRAITTKKKPSEQLSFK